MLNRIDQNLKFEKKRNYNLTTPCCHSNNKDGKFVNYKGLPEIYGYCHSCGKTSMPPTIYQDEAGRQYTWNKELNQWDTYDVTPIKTSPAVEKPKVRQKFIENMEVNESLAIKPENNLTKYLKATYHLDDVYRAIDLYYLGNTTDGGTIFWQIDSQYRVLKNKICYYNHSGKRTKKFKVPYKNEDGYFSGIFGEHLMFNKSKKNQKIALVESEKTAIVGEILLPKYRWMAFGGINGLTEEKIKCFQNQEIVLIPDISNNAVEIASRKINELEKNGNKPSLLDMTEGKSDDQLKLEGIYNNDLEDCFRSMH